MTDELKRLHEAADTLRLWQRAMRGDKGLPLKATDALRLIKAIDTVLDASLIPAERYQALVEAAEGTREAWRAVKKHRLPENDSQMGRADAVMCMDGAVLLVEGTLAALKEVSP